MGKQNRIAKSGKLAIFVAHCMLYTLACYTQEPIIISLGSDCRVAAAIAHGGLRQAAYPFDWIVSSPEGISAVIQDDFAHFLEEQYLRVRADSHGIVDYYGFEFVHDFPTYNMPITLQINPYKEDSPEYHEDLIRPEWLTHLDLVANKYHRRINRFRKALQSTVPIYAIIHNGGMTPKRALALRNTIINHFPHSKVTLVCVSSAGNFTNWHLEGIQTFNIDDSQAWNNPQDWQRIFTTLGLVVQKNIITTCVCSKPHIYHV